MDIIVQWNKSEKQYFAYDANIPYHLPQPYGRGATVEAAIGNLIMGMASNGLCEIKVTLGKERWT